jgi:hypothetical protein
MLSASATLTDLRNLRVDTREDRVTAGSDILQTVPGSTIWQSCAGAERSKLLGVPVRDQPLVGDPEALAQRLKDAHGAIVTRTPESDAA